MRPGSDRRAAQVARLAAAVAWADAGDLAVEHGDVSIFDFAREDVGDSPAAQHEIGRPVTACDCQ